MRIQDYCDIIESVLRHKHVAGQSAPEPSHPPTLNQVLLEILYYEAEHSSA